MSFNRFTGITQYVTEGKIGESENAIGRMTALRWEPTHIAKHTSRDIPLHIPAIIMIGTRPIFYKIPVTQALSDAVARAQYSAFQTTVFKCTVNPFSRRQSNGMEAPEFRQDILKHYNAFKAVARECWQTFIL